MKTNDIIDPALVQADRIMVLEQEVNRLRNENAFLRRELRPPEAEKKELKYWIVTWLDRWSLGYKFESEAIAEWPNVLKRKAELEPRPGVSHIRILGQIVYV